MGELMSGAHLVRTIRLDDEQVTRILDELDAASSGHVDRLGPRYIYRKNGLVIHMQHPGSSNPVAYQVRTRNLGSQGLSFLHGGFVHPGTRCLVELTTAYGTWNYVTGITLRCRFVEANLHEVAVRFEQVVDPASYCPDATQTRVLLVEDDPLVARLARFYLEKLNVVVDQAENGKIALECVKGNTYDVILLDMVMPVMDGFEVARELRRRGFSRTIAAVTGMTQPGDREKCLEAGCDLYLPKPFVESDFVAMLDSLREEPLFSNFHDDPSMRQLIHEFVAELPAGLRAIEQAMEDQDVATLEVLARRFKAEGSGYGFDIITEVAGRIERSLIDDGRLDAVREDVQLLVKLCDQARAPLDISSLGAKGSNEPGSKPLILTSPSAAT